LRFAEDGAVRLVPIGLPRFAAITEGLNMESLVRTVSDSSRLRGVRCAIGVVALVLALGVLAPRAPAATLACGDTVTQDTVLDADVVCTNPADIGLVIGADNITLQLAHHTVQGAGATTSGASFGITDDGTVHTGVTIRGGTVSGFDTGIYFQADDSAIKGMTLTDFDNGVFFLGDRNYLYHSSFEAPGTLAADVVGTDNYLWGNHVTGNPDDGIVVSGNNSLVVRNSVDTCGFNGLAVDGYSVAKIALNAITGCDTGIVITGDNAKLQTNTVSGNSDGLFVTDPGALVRFNTAEGNSGSGIVVGLPGATVFKNSVTDNGDYGIDAVLGTIDGGENTASGNTTGGCVVVACTPQP
jgi:hypothetical protein